MTKPKDPLNPRRRRKFTPRQQVARKGKKAISRRLYFIFMYREYPDEFRSKYRIEYTEVNAGLIYDLVLPDFKDVLALHRRHNKDRTSEKGFKKYMLENPHYFEFVFQTELTESSLADAWEEMEEFEWIWPG